MAPEISHILFIYSDFIFLLYLPILKVSCVYLEWLKSLNWKDSIEGPHFRTQNFVKFYLSLIFAYPENLMCLA